MKIMEEIFFKKIWASCKPKFYNREEIVILEGVEIVKDNVRKLSQKPGVYRMIDKNGDILYVGKAKNLRNRVASYA